LKLLRRGPFLVVIAGLLSSPDAAAWTCRGMLHNRTQSQATGQRKTALE
jgi:hypothetical protein